MKILKMKCQRKRNIKLEKRKSDTITAKDQQKNQERWKGNVKRIDGWKQQEK